jgi:hypothetical protein
MVQNLPVHYDNPAFRDDMLQVISKSVDKIDIIRNKNGMLSSLNNLRNST